MRVHANINLDTIRNNIIEIKKNLSSETHIMAIIKADGYGHGSVEVANALRGVGVHSFGVAIIEEGILLRRRGITKPILILGYTSKYQFAELIQYELSQTIFQFSMAKSVSEFAGLMDKKAVIHIAIDTGMNRIGFKPNQETISIIKKIIELPNIEVEGIFTHLANADEEDKTGALRQLKVFTDFLDQLSAQGINIPIVHTSNSAATIDLETSHFNMVRCGIATYGLYPSKEVSHDRFHLTPALQLKSHVVYIKTVGAGEGVSYNSTYITTRETVIATIPVGYADGYPRALSSKGRVLIHGQYAPILGRICMDQFMVDVTHIPDIHQEDEVTLVGIDGENEITVEEVADLAGSFNYEFVCGLAKRVPRVYIENDEITRTVDYLTD